MRYHLDRGAVSAEPLPDDTAGVVQLVDDAQGCEKFVQRVLEFRAGRSRARADDDADEVLFVLSGAGTVELGGRKVPVKPSVGLFVGRGTRWAVDADGGLELLSVLVRDPEPEAAGASGIVDLGAEERRSATAARQFTLGVTPAVGCASVTQFIGFIPPGRAPDHYHHYDEVLYVLESEGVLHIGGEEAPLHPGVCVHLPARLVHSLENGGRGEMRVLGVFRPAGSPAEAYYPDGTPAVYPDPAADSEES